MPHPSDFRERRGMEMSTTEQELRRIRNEMTEIQRLLGDIVSLLLDIEKNTSK